MMGRLAATTVTAVLWKGPAREGDPGFEVHLDVTRSESANDDAAEHGVMLRGAMRW